MIKGLLPKENVKEVSHAGAAAAFDWRLAAIDRRLAALVTEPGCACDDGGAWLL